MSQQRKDLALSSMQTFDFRDAKAMDAHNAGGVSGVSQRRYFLLKKSVERSSAGG
jgi:hypothetical protein